MPPECRNQVVNLKNKCKKRGGGKKNTDNILCWTGGGEQDADWQGICSRSSQVQYGATEKMKEKKRKEMQTDGGDADEEEDEQDRETVGGGTGGREE